MGVEGCLLLSSLQSEVQENHRTIFQSSLWLFSRVGDAALFDTLVILEWTGSGDRAGHLEGRVTVSLRSGTWPFV